MRQCRCDRCHALTNLVRMRFLRLGKGCPRRFEGIEFMDDDMKAALGLLEDVDSDQVTDVPQSQPSRPNAPLQD